MLVASERWEPWLLGQNLLELLEEKPEVMTRGERKLLRDEPLDLYTRPSCS